jgi:predicted MFS family arabinose efflux permease
VGRIRCLAGLDARALFLSAAGLVAYHMALPMGVSTGHAGWVLSGYDVGLLIVALLATRSSRDFFRAQIATAPERASRPA